MAAYAQRCCHQGVPVDWRAPSLCRKSQHRERETCFIESKTSVLKDESEAKNNSDNNDHFKILQTLAKPLVAA